LRHGLRDIVTRTSFTEGVLHLSVTDSGGKLTQPLEIDVGRAGGVGHTIVEKLSALYRVPRREDRVGDDAASTKRLSEVVDGRWPALGRRRNRRSTSSPRVSVALFVTAAR
jgi:hypothetical protein